MKLYYKRGSCSLTVRILILELKLICDYEAVDLQTKQTETGANFLTVNAKGSVPALLLDNQEVLTENAVILQYLADTHHAIQYLPPINDGKRYHVLEWLNFCCTDLHGACGPLFNANISHELKQEVFIPALKRKINVVEKHLATQPYLLGDAFTLADIYLFVVLTWLPLMKIELTEWPHIAKYFATVNTRPAIQQALSAERVV